MSENRGGFLIGILAILLVIVLMIPITAIFIDPDTPDTPDPLNTPIYELNNHSLTELFEDTTTLLESEQLITNEGNPFIATTDWLCQYGVLSVASDNLVFTANNTGTFPSIRNALTYTAGKKYYFATKVMVHLATSATITFRENTTPYTTIATQATPTNDTWYFLSAVPTLFATGAVRTDVSVVNGDTLTKQYEYSFDIDTLIADEHDWSPLYETTFDLMTDEQIKLQMDWFIANPHFFLPYRSLGIGNLTDEQIEHYYALYLYYSGL